MASSTTAGGPADRVESIVRAGGSRGVVLVPGAVLRPLADAARGARGMFTGVLTLAPAASVPYYVRSASEALVVLEGTAAVDVEDRRYRLGSLDAAAVAPSRPRKIANLADDRPAVLHVAVATAEPAPTWVNGRFEPADRPPDDRGRAGSERIVRYRDVPATELAPRAQFRDLYNAELGTSGICGGHGVFEPGARLPCHRHLYDESITIVDGTAACIVEGRRHELSDLGTAIVPEGRCHYFINPTPRPMAMIWVYAGDMPDRIVVDEALCHPEASR